MDKLAETLHAAGVDVSTLELIFQADMEAIHRLTVPGAEAIQTWERLRGLVPQTGYWPVLLGEDKQLQRLLRLVQRLRYPRAVRILEEAATIDPLEWFKNRRLDEIEYLEREVEAKEDVPRWMKAVNLLSKDGPYRGMPQGAWPDDVNQSCVSILPGRRDAADLPPRSMHLGLVSTEYPWQVPAYLRYGAWNECPSAAEHAAIAKYWGQKYGADIMVAAGDMIEMRVSRPPTSRDEALELAAQQYLYCRDIVTQATETVQRLAATLLGGTVWFFWWD